jgi:4-hydroxybenzoyl-CoA reductase subunit alpha
MANLSSIIGAPVWRVEGAEKVSGQAAYGADVHFPGTLWGKILRSPYAHARIVRIDTSKALQVPGVKATIIRAKAFATFRCCAGTKCATSATRSRR